MNVIMDELDFLNGVGSAAPASLNRPAVDCTGVQKFFGDGDTRVHVLRGVDFSARSGELTFIVGPSGCGKTTLISVVAGLLDPSGGDVRVFSENMAKMKPAELVRFRRRHMGFVFQQYNLLPALNAVENACVPLLAAGMPRREACDRARDLLCRLGLEKRLDAFPSKLSGGQQQRVALARALVHEPKLVVCDEPTAALDHATGEKVMELLATAAVQPDRAVVVVTHDNRVYHYADAIAHMDDGAILRTERQRSSRVASSGAHTTHHS